MTVVSFEEQDLILKMGTVQVMSDEDVRAVPQMEEQNEAGFGALTSARGNFPLRSVKVTARLSDLCSHVTLDLTFLNAFDTPLEATYISPLPPQAAVTSFRFEVKNRVVEGVIKERGEARQEYAQAVQDGHRAAIVEEERQGVFTIRVGNIGAGETASVRLTMAAPIPVSDGEATFRFPLLVAPRYIPGVRLSGADVGLGSVPDTNETPDASRLTPPQKVTLPGFLDPVQLSIEVEFDVTTLPVSNVRCSLHTVTVSDIETNDSQDATCPPIAIRRLRLDPAVDARLDRDFILRFNVTVPDHVAASLILSDDPDSESQEGTWQLTLVAPKGAGNGAAATPRDVVFVIDRSGSMAGWKMVAARSAAAKVVNTLSDADRFTVLAFDNAVECPFDTSASGSATSSSIFATSGPTACSFPSAFNPHPSSIGLFGSSSTGPQHGNNNPTPPANSTFGTPPGTGVFGAPSSNGSVFGNPSANEGLFGNSSFSSGGIFGNSSSSSGGLFAQNSSSSGNAFGTNSSSSGGCFGNPAPSSSLFGTPSSSAMFGGTFLNATVPNQPPSNGSLFGGTPTSSSLFGGFPGGSSFAQPAPSLFTNQTPPPQPVTLVAANYANRQRARNFLATLSARGGTEMAGPLTRAADALQGLEGLATVEGSGGFWPLRGAAVRERVLVLVTDGQVGHEDWIMGQLAPKMQGIRVFTLGIDQSVNETFLRRLSGLSPGGACELVESQGRLEYAMDRIHRLIATPVLSDIQIDGPQGTIPETITPSRIPGLFPGVPVVVSGRYRKLPDSASMFVTVSGKTASGENGTEVVRAREKQTAAASALWARAHICDLDDRFAIAAAPRAFGPAPADAAAETPADLRARILETSLRFQVLSRFTAFVAVDRVEKLPSTAGEVTHVVQPVEPPAGWQYSAPVTPIQLFGQPPNPLVNPPSLFGQTQNPASGATMQGAGRVTSALGGYSHPPIGARTCPAFGATPVQSFAARSYSGFEAPSQCPAFCGMPSAFGAPSQSTQSTFGAPSHSGFGASSHSAFGGPRTTPFGGTTFGSSTAPSFGSSAFGAASHSAFGASSQSAFGGSTSPFGGSSSASLFGAASHSAFGACSQPAFGGSSMSSFGAPSQSAFGGSSFSSFGTPALGGSAFSAFGPPAQTTAGAFSHSAFGASSSSAFGASTGSAFGAAPSLWPFTFSPSIGLSGGLSGPASAGAVSHSSPCPSWGPGSVFPCAPADPFKIFGSAPGSSTGIFGAAPSAPGSSTGGFGYAPSVLGSSTEAFGSAPPVPGSSTGVFGAARNAPEGSTGAFNGGLSGTGSFGGGPSIPCALTGFAVPLPDSDSEPAAPHALGSALPAVAGFGGLASACLGALNALKADESSEKRGRLLIALRQIRGRLEGGDNLWVGDAISFLENGYRLDASFFERLAMVLNRAKYPDSVPA